MFLAHRGMLASTLPTCAMDSRVRRNCATRLSGIDEPTHRLPRFGRLPAEWTVRISGQAGSERLQMTRSVEARRA